MAGDFSMLEVSENIKDFILGGKAYFSICQEATEGSAGGKENFCVTRSKDGKCYFVNKDSSGSSKGAYLGFFYKDDVGRMSKLRQTRRLSEVSDSVAKPLIVVLNCLETKGRLPGNGIVHIVSAGRCSVCGRKLTDYESMKYGMGPECRKKFGSR